MSTVKLRIRKYLVSQRPKKLDEIFEENEDNYLRFRVFATDEMSSFGKLFK